MTKRLPGLLGIKAIGSRRRSVAEPGQTPWMQTRPVGRPPGGKPPPDVEPPGLKSSALHRSVCILLECILGQFKFPNRSIENSDNNFEIAQFLIKYATSFQLLLVNPLIFV